MIPLLLVTVAHAQEIGASAAHHVAQARQFLKKGWLDDAAAEIEAALALPDGVADPEVAALGAQVYFRLHDLARCLPLARRAADLAPTDAARAEADAWVGLLEATYGFVEVRVPVEGLSSRLQLEADGPVIDPAHRAWIDAVALRLRARTPLPLRLGLPAGAYRINGQSVVVEPSATAVLDLPMSALGARGLAALQVARLELTTGMSVPIAADGRLPSPVAELSLTQPVGPVLVGAVGAWEPRGHLTPDGVDAGATGWSAGLRAGHEWALGGPLSVRPSLGLRYASVPGVRLACDGTTDGLDCDGGEDAVVMATARAVAAFGELSVDWRSAGRTTRPGVGVVLGIDHLRGRVPDGVALSGSGPDADPVPYAVDAPWSATFVRLAARASLVF